MRRPLGAVVGLSRLNQLVIDKSLLLIFPMNEIEQKEQDATFCSSHVFPLPE
jgi:hypothetical protein